MSWAISPLGQEEHPQSEVPKIYSDSYRHSIVDSNFQPERSLLIQVEGTPRMCEYYRVFGNRDEEPTPFDPSNVSTYQSYTRIKRCIIKQEGDGSFSFNPENGENTKDINGYAINELTPIKNDVMIFDIGDGNAGLFIVYEQPEPFNITANKVWRLTYKFLCILTRELFENLNGKVVEERVYDQDAAFHSGQSVIAPEQYDVGLKLFKWQQTIAQYIMTKWYWNSEKTIGYTVNKNQYVYDPYLANFIRAVLPNDMLTTYPSINLFSLQYGGLERGYHGTMNVWDVLLRGDFNILPICSNRAAMIETIRLVDTRLYGNLRSSKFTWFICTNPEDFLTYKAYFQADGYPILKPGTQTDFSGYVFSEGFFKGETDDPFEQLVISALKYKVLDKKKLLEYCEGYFALEERKQLYHGAILLLLLQVSRKLGNPL